MSSHAQIGCKQMLCQLLSCDTVTTWRTKNRHENAMVPYIHGMMPCDCVGQVVDSPFAKLTELMLELVEEQKIPIPRSLMRVALSMMRRSVKKRAGFNIDEVAPIDQIHTSFIPCLFGESSDCSFASNRPAFSCKQTDASTVQVQGKLARRQNCSLLSFGRQLCNDCMVAHTHSTQQLVS